MRVTRHPWMLSYVFLCSTEIFFPRFGERLTWDDVAMLGLHVARTQRLTWPNHGIKSGNHGTWRFIVVDATRIHWNLGFFPNNFWTLGHKIPAFCCRKPPSSVVGSILIREKSPRFCFQLLALSTWISACVPLFQTSLLRNLEKSEGVDFVGGPRVSWNDGHMGHDVSWVKWQTPCWKYDLPFLP